MGSRSPPFASPENIEATLPEFQARESSRSPVELPLEGKEPKLSLLRVILALIVLLILAHIVLVRLGYVPDTSEVVQPELSRIM